MPTDLWLKETVLWSRQQADLLRRLRAGERVEGLDWDNIIEEIESVGRMLAHTVRDRLVEAVIRLMKLRAWPDDPAATDWRDKAGDLLMLAQHAFQPSMMLEIDLPDTLRYARERFRIRFDYSPGRPVPEDGQIPIEALRDGDFMLEDLEAALFPPA